MAVPREKIRVMILAAVLTFFISGCNPPSISVGGLGSPADDVASFFGSLKTGNYDEADSYLENYKSLGFGGSAQTPLQEKFFEMLASNRAFSLVGEPKISGRSGTVTIELTSLDFRKLEDKLAEMIDARKNDGDALDSEEAIEEALTETLDGMDMAACCTTEQFVLDVKYADSKWKIVVAENFYSALIGYAV